MIDKNKFNSFASIIKKKIFSKQYDALQFVNQKLQTLSREIGYSDNVAFLISNKEYISYTHVNTLLPPLLNVPKKEFSV